MVFFAKYKKGINNKFSIFNYKGGGGGMQGCSNLLARAPFEHGKTVRRLNWQRFPFQYR